MTDNALNVHQRLARVMSEVTYIQKEKKQGMQYSIVSHDKVTAILRTPLLNAGIVYYPVKCDHTHNVNRAECSMVVRFVNIDNPTDFFDVSSFGYGIDSQDKGPGKAMSYAVKYALLKATGLETGDDPDQENIPHGPEPQMVNSVIEAINSKESINDLVKYWNQLNSDRKAVAADARVIEAKDKRKKEITQ